MYLTFRTLLPNQINFIMTLAERKINLIRTLASSNDEQLIKGLETFLEGFRPNRISSKPSVVGILSYHNMEIENINQLEGGERDF